MTLLPDLDVSFARSQIEALAASGRDLLVTALDGAPKDRLKLARQGAEMLSTAAWRAVEIASASFFAGMLRSFVGMLPQVARTQQDAQQPAGTPEEDAPVHAGLELAMVAEPRLVAVYRELGELGKQLNTCTSAADREELGRRFGALRAEYVQLRNQHPLDLAGLVGRAARERLGLVSLELELAEAPADHLVQLRDKLERLLAKIAEIDAHAEVDRLVS